jgi:hypothetical protein
MIVVFGPRPCQKI